ncbi:MAG: hypothetical protein LBH44_02380 [Treponema sp.]|jgi:sugar lactone lactonase YvrE|nr:hypothetical protein [Treponema sp.]
MYGKKIVVLISLALLLLGTCSLGTNIDTLRGMLGWQVTTIAQIDHPIDVAVDGKGNVYVTNLYKNELFISKITPGGKTDIFYDGYYTSLAVDSAGNIYVAEYNYDYYKFCIWKINPYGGIDFFYYDDNFKPTSIAVDSKGNVYVADTGNHCIRKITPDGTVITIAGNGTVGYADGKANGVRFDSPSDIAIDEYGNVYVADTGNHCIRKITPDGTVITIAGHGYDWNYIDGKAVSARFYSPSGVAIDSKENVYVADTGNHCIRKITPDGMVSTIAGDTTPGFADRPGYSARFNSPNGVAVDNNGNVYVADTENNRIRKLSPPLK